ncbi:acetyltransferase [Streptomyces sp. NBC_00435]|uniref:GNAT family N-acetyltransferase n=1 Tax=Streptomyces sp. NBC_00435 TaxID=2903649 RepID=UPI002E1D9ED1
MTTSTGTTAPDAAAPAPATRQPVHIHVVEGLGTVTLTPLDPAADSGLVHAWVSEGRAAFCGTGGVGRELVREAYEALDRRTTRHAYLARCEGQPVALFQTYDCAEDRVGGCYEVRPGDIGVHLLIDPDHGGAEQALPTALSNVFLTYLLSEPSVRRVVAEPDARDDGAMDRLQRTGFTLGPEVELPEIDLPGGRLPAKRARLLTLDVSGALPEIR